MLQQWIEQHWKQPTWYGTWLLKPLSYLFAHIVRHRRQRFLRTRHQLEKLPIPVVVIGNIHVGGVGKTPIVSAVVRSLQQQGIAVGIISRGYGRSKQTLHLITHNSTADEAGDEPLLLYQQTKAPIAVSANRLEAGNALLAAHPNLALLIADDGLQHYALWRDIEIIVFPFNDTQRTAQLDVLPNGNLREPLCRLHECDAIVFSNCPTNATLPDSNIPLFTAHTSTQTFYRLNCPEERRQAHELSYQTAAALAGIANPERFFHSLNTLGITLKQHKILPDHAPINHQDLPQADIVFITEKDAVKLTPNEHTRNVWVLPICANITPDLTQWIQQRIKQHHADGKQP